MLIVVPLVLVAVERAGLDPRAVVRARERSEVGRREEERLRRVRERSSRTPRPAPSDSKVTAETTSRSCAGQRERSL